MDYSFAIGQLRKRASNGDPQFEILDVKAKTSELLDPLTADPAKFDRVQTFRVSGVHGRRLMERALEEPNAKLEDLSKEKLIELAVNAGIEVDPRATKSDLIKAIKAKVKS